MKERVGFFGGAFNPPSKMHIDLANKLIESDKIDKVIFVPVGDFYDKKELALAKHRYNMLKIAIKSYEKLEIDNIELNINKKLYAADIFKLIKEKYKNKNIYFIMGSDNYDKMPNWKEYNTIIDKYQYIVLERIKDDLSSSTRIREMIKQNIDTSELLHEEVLKYIEENQLYK